MTLLSLLIAVAALIGLALIWRALNIKRACISSQHCSSIKMDLPPELKAGRLIMVEQEIYVERPHKISARLDQVYEIMYKGKTHLVPADFKTRATNRVYDTDVAEVSLQAWMLRNCAGSKKHHVAPFGYILIHNTTDKRMYPKKFTLLSDQECENMIERYFDLVNPREYAVPTPLPASSKKCVACSHKKRCGR